MLTKDGLKPSNGGGAQMEPRSRRKFVGAAFAAAAAVPLVGARAASADGTSPAYTDSANVFTRDQRVNARLGINRAPSYSLDVDGTGDPSSFAVRLQNDRNVMFIEQSVTPGAPWDTVDIFHRGTGDGVFVNHLGGLPPGHPGPAGGDAGFNVMIPEKLDHTGTGRDGSVTNDRTDMTGLNIDSQAPNAKVRGIWIRHAGKAEAIYIQNQDPNSVQGNGAPLTIDDWSTRDSILINKWTNTGSALLTLNAFTQSGGSPQTVNVIRVKDSTQSHNFLLQSTGYIETKLSIYVDGQMRANRGTNQITLSAENGRPTVVFGSAGDSSIWRAAAGRLATVGLTIGGTLGHTGPTVGFYGANPVAKPTVTGSRRGNDALASLLSALAKLGLITDSTNG
jgi:hypothetical protein